MLIYSAPSEKANSNQRKAMQYDPKHSSKDPAQTQANLMHSQENNHSEHESPIKTPKQLVTVIVLSFLIPIIVILLLVNYVGFGDKGNNEENSEALINKRIKPIAELNYVDAAAPVVYKTGEQVYQAVCLSCHASGAAGAPKLGDASSWAPRLAQGLDALVQSVINGKGAMAARAGTSADDYSDYELTRAVVYMTGQSGGKFSEPIEPSTNAASMVAPITNMPAASAALEPVAAIVASVVAPMTIAPAIDGQKIYEQACIACHSAGVAGAPKFADKTAWAPRIANGKEALYTSVLNGKGAMPAKGGHAGSDDEVKAAADYMIAAGK
jgi:cytochrome c5